MTAKDILSFFYQNSVNLTPGRILLILAMALAGGVVIWFTYRFTTEHSVYNPVFGISHLFMVLLTCVIMLMISVNIVISLGMVGALSIIRFRTAVKDPRNTMFLFWAMVAGLCIGSQNFVLAALSTLFISAVLFVVFLLPKHRTRFTLIVCSTLGAEELQALLGTGVSCRLQAMQAGGDGAAEYVFTLSGRHAACVAAATALEKNAAVQQVNLISPGAD